MCLHSNNCSACCYHFQNTVRTIILLCYWSIRCYKRIIIFIRSWYVSLAYIVSNNLLNKSLQKVFALDQQIKLIYMHILANMYDCKCPVKTKKTIWNRNNMNKRYCFYTWYKFVRFSDLSTRRQLPGTSKCYYRQTTVIKTTRNIMLKLFYCARKGDNN